MSENAALQPLLAKQIVYLDFDGENTEYNNADLGLNFAVTVKDSGMTEEQKSRILQQLSEQYENTGVVFTLERPAEGAYSSVFIGQSDDFKPYGNFAGLAETIDLGNKNGNDDAFVMLDASAPLETVIATISHETDHLLGVNSHGFGSLENYAVIGALDVAKKNFYNAKMDSYDAQIKYYQGASLYELQKLLKDSGGSLSDYTTTTTVTTWPDLTPYKPDDWDGRIIVSTKKNTEENASKIYDNQELYVDFAVTNKGDKAASNAESKLYVDGVLVKTISSDSLKAGYYHYTKDVSIGTLSAGTHTISVVTDPSGKVSESNENNNSCTKTIKVRATYADLAISSFYVRSTASKSSDVSCSFVVKNKGNRASSATSVAVYDGSKRIDTIYIDAIDAKSSCKGRFTIAAGTLSTKTHSLKLYVDRDKYVTESNEKNNASAVRKLKITAPDLQISKFSVTSSASVTGKVKLSVTVANKGNAAVSKSRLYVYSDGKLLTDVVVDALKAGKSKKCTFSVAASKLGAGKHSVYVMADGTKKFSESNEKNNKSDKKSVVVKASDLQISKFSVSSTATVGGKVKLSVTVANKGKVGVGKSRLYVYADGEFLTDVVVDALNAGKSKKCTFSIAASKLGAGRHSLYVVADGTDKFTESNEGNNESKVCKVSISGGASVKTGSADAADFWSALENVAPVSELTGWSGDGADLFKVELAQDGTLLLDFDEKTAELVGGGRIMLGCFDSAGNEIGLTWNAGRSDYVSAEELDSGIYYVGVNGTAEENENFQYGMKAGILA